MANLTRAAKAEREAQKHLIPYVSAGRDAGCPPDQMTNFIKAGLILQPKQLEMSAWARRCDSREGPNCLGVGGSRGGSKTHWIFSQVCADDCQRFPGLKGIALRKTGKAMREQLADLRTKICGNLPHKYKEQQGLMEFSNGSKLLVAHFKDEKEIENFIGQEYDFIAIEELTTLTFEKWKNLMSCLRSSKDGWRPRMYASWNWGGVGHFWVKKIFYEPYRINQEKETKFIKATIYDNPLLMKNDPDYVRFLESLTGWKRKSWLEGDPDFQTGQFFVNWNEDVHVYPNKDTMGMPSTFVKWFCSFDHGFSHPCCCHLHAEDRLGNLYTVDEYHQTETVPFENAENIKAMLRSHNIGLHDLDFFVAGNDCFNRNAEGKTIASMYEDYGIYMTPAKTDRINRWEIMGDRLGNIEKGVPPRWFINKKCRNLISQIPMAQAHETRIGDIAKQNADENGENGDDALECFLGETFITTKSGDIAIKDVKVGDLVLTREGYKTVLKSWMTKKSASVIELTFRNGRRIVCTPNHPLLSPCGSWIRAGNFVEGNSLTAFTYSYGGITSTDYTTVTSSRKLKNLVPVYNLEVEDCHEYFANGILAHNCASFGLSSHSGNGMKFAQPMSMGKPIIEIGSGESSIHMG